MQSLNPGTHADRLLVVNVQDMPVDCFKLKSFYGTEEMSQPFKFRLEVEFDPAQATVDKGLIGREVSFRLQTEGDQAHYFHGLIGRMSRRPVDHNTGRAICWLEVLPKLWLLSRTADCRIFQDVSVLDVVETLLGDAGFSGDDYAVRTLQGYEQWDYCVQYRETDFAFLSRLLEENGIFYYFEMSDGGHKLILADDATSYANPTPLNIELSNQVDYDRISHWEQNFELRPDSWTQTDYNFLRPSDFLMTVSGDNGSTDREIYDYPGKFIAHDPGDALTKIRLEREIVQGNRVEGKGWCLDMSAARVFKFSEDPAVDPVDYVVTKVSHQSVEKEGDEHQFEYQNEFAGIPLEVDERPLTFRPERLTPKPVVEGPQTAVVTGSEGELVQPDEFGRVKVQFFWDRLGQKDENSSCWVRVSQDWAGKQYGALYLPHLGQEVIVDFLEGDPDRPIITGRVYNAEQMPPITLPDEKYKCVIARDHFGNEIVFDGTEGDEHIRIRSPHHASQIQIGKSVQYVTASDDKKLIIGNKITGTFGNALSVFAGVKESFTVGLTISATVGIGIDFGLTAKFSAVASAEIKIAYSSSVSYANGFSYSESSAESYENVSKQKTIKCIDKIVIDGDKGVFITGGDVDACELTMQKDYFAMTYGKGSATSTALKDKMELVKSTARKLTGLAFLTAGGAAGLAVAGAAVNARKQADLHAGEEGAPSGNWGDSFGTGAQIAAFGGAALVTVAGVAAGVFYHTTAKSTINGMTKDKEAQTENHSQVVLTEKFGVLRANKAGEDLEEKSAESGISWFLCKDDGSIEIVGGDEKSSKVEIMANGAIMATAGKSKIWVKKDGAVSLDAKDSNETVQLLGGKRILLKDTTKLVLYAPVVEAKQGTFETANIKDLG